MPGPDQADRDRVRRQIEAARARRAARASLSSPSMTTEMLRSDAPCAIARTLTPALAERAEDLARRRRACRPCRRRPRRGCCSPRRRSTLWIWPCAQLGGERALARPLRRARPRRSGTAKQIECSELPCEIRITEMPSSRSAPNSRCAVPGTPIMPGAFEVDERDAVDGRDALHRRRRDAASARDQRARLLGRERVADPDRDAACRPPAPSSADG